MDIAIALIWIAIAAIVSFLLCFPKMINASKKRTKCMTGKEYDKYIFEKWKLKQIAEHLLIYCNHNKEVEE